VSLAKPANSSAAHSLRSSHHSPLSARQQSPNDKLATFPSISFLFHTTFKMSGVSAPKNAQKYYPAEDVKTPRTVRIVLLHPGNMQSNLADGGGAHIQSHSVCGLRFGCRSRCSCACARNISHNESDTAIACMVFTSWLRIRNTTTISSMKYLLINLF